MKYILSFLMMFFIGLTSMSISAYAYNNTVYFEYPNTPVQAAIDMIDSRLGDSDQYYVLFYYRIPSLSTSQNGYEGYQKLCFDTNTTWTIPQGSQITWSSFSPQTLYKRVDVFHGRTGAWNYGSNVPSFTTMSGNFLGTLDYNIYIIENTIPIVYNGQTLDPPSTLQGDTYFVTKEGYTCNFGVFCGPGSELVTPSGDTDLASNYYRTKKYTVNVEFEYQNSTVTYTIPNYLNWLYKYSVYVDKEFDDTSNVLSQIIDFIKAYTFYAEPVYNNTMQAIRCPVVNSPIIGTPMWPFEDMTDYRSFNQITLSQLLGALVSSYPNITINDLYTELHFKFYDDSGKLCYEGVNDYSSLYNSGVEPEPDPYVTDLTKATDELNQYLISNNKYLQNIMYGDTYNPMPYETAIKDAGNVNLDLISIPDYSYTKHNLDTGATSFFGRMVEWWYLDTPFGMIATVALTLLVIRVILW